MAALNVVIGLRATSPQSTSSDEVCAELTPVGTGLMLLVMGEKSEQLVLTEIGNRLAQEFPNIAPGLVAVAVQQAHGRFASSRIRDYVPLFVEKHARQLLANPTALAETG